MRNIKIYCLLFVASLLTLQSAKAQGRAAADTLRVQFRVGQSNLDLNFSNNGAQIESFVKRAWARFGSYDPDELQVNLFTGASPEGPAELNRRLGEQRGIALRDVLQQRLEGLVKHVTIVNEGARWGGLYNMVRDSNEPWREDVLKILGKRPANDDWQTDDREQQLRRLKGGSVWRELNSRYLPILRSSGSAIIASTKTPVRDTIVIRDTIIYLPEPCPQYEPPIDLSPAWAIKTNLLLWGVIAPNIQVERSLGKTNRWSIEGEFFWPWWTWSHNAHAEQFMNLGFELRYWLGNRAKHHTLDGWHIGGGLAAGYYDFEWKRSEGWQGEYLNIYCNIGYQHRFGRRNQWLVDGGIGLGYIPTKFRHYLGSSRFPVGHEEEYDDHLMWQDSGWKHIIGATHVNFTLGYVIGAKKKKAAVDEAYAWNEYEAQAAERADKNAKAAAKQANKEAKAAAKQAEKDAKAAAKQAEKDAKAAAKQGGQSAKAAAKQADKDAKLAAKLAERDAKAAAKAAANQAEMDAKFAAKAAKASKQAEEDDFKAFVAKSKADEKAAKAAAKQADKDAKAAAKQAYEDAKAADKAAKAAAKQADKNAKAAAKQAYHDAKAADKAAKNNAKKEEI